MRSALEKRGSSWVPSRREMLGALGVGLLVPRIARAAAFTLVAHTGGGLGPSGGTSSAINTTGASLLIAAVTAGGAASVSDSKGNTWAGLNLYSSSSSVQIFYAKNPTVGAGHTITVSGSYSGACFAAFSGADLSAPFDGQQSGDTSGASHPGTITPAEAGALIISVSSGGGAGGPSTADLTMLDRYGFTGGQYYGGGAAYAIQGTATAINPDWGLGNTPTSIASFKPSTTSPSTARRRVISGGE